MRNRCCCFIRENVRQTLVCRYLTSTHSKRQTKVCRTSFHRVVTARAKRLAAQKPPDSQACSADSSMSFNCFARIFGAGWNKTAGRRQPWRDYCFVKLQKRNQNKTHRLVWHRLQSVNGCVTDSGLCHSVSRARPAPPAQQSYETHESEVLRSP